MAGTFDFSGVESASQKAITRPGTIDDFKITALEFQSSKNKGTPYMRCTFENKDSNFSHSFFLKASDADKTKKMLSRIQLVVEMATGSKLTGNISEEQIKMKLVGKELALKVTGEVSSNGKGYPTLPFGAFAAKKGEGNFLSFTTEEEKNNLAAIEAIEASRSHRADNELGTDSLSNTDESLSGIVGYEESSMNTMEENPKF